MFMTFIIGLAVVAAATVGVFMVGVQVGKNKTSDLNRSDRKELESRRDFMENLGVKAAEHAVLGDQFAVIVSSDLLANRNQNR